MEKKDVCVYLAGPMTGCNEQQRTEWRKSLKRELKARGYSVLDPTDDTARKGAYAVTADVDEADVVIANLWKESIGTVLGIVQARRSDTPVILIDEHYINSPVLAAFADCVVRNEERAVNALEDLFSKVSRSIHVLKKDGKQVSFDRRKLRRSLRSALNQTGCDDSVLLSKLLKESQRRISRESKRSQDTISTASIRRLIFEVLEEFAGDEHNKDIGAVTSLLWEKWGNYELKKGDNEAYDELVKELDALRDARDAAELEVQNLRAMIGALARTEISVETIAYPPENVPELQIGKIAALVEFMERNPVSRGCFEIRSSAKKSYQDLPYSEPERLACGLALLRDSFVPSKVAVNPILRLAAWDAFTTGLRENRFQYGPTATTTGRGRFRDDHTVRTEDGRHLPCHKVRDVRTTFDRQHFLCIYFAWDEKCRKLHLKGFEHGATQNDHT